MITLFDADEYMNKIAPLAFYPHSGEKNVGALIYCDLGLTGESSEAIEKLRESPLGYENVGFGEIITSDEKDKIVKELGDVLWYLTRFSVELGETLSSIIPNDLTSDNSNEILKSRISIGNTFLGLASYSGKPSEILKKILRDDNFTFFEQIADSKREAIVSVLSDVYWWLDRCAASIESSMEEVAQGNLDKLFSRNKRGVLSGSGDNR